jgi:hypothetical protein
MALTQVLPSTVVCHSLFWILPSRRSRICTVEERIQDVEYLWAWATSQQNRKGKRKGQVWGMMPRALSLPLPPRISAAWPPTCIFVTVNGARRYLAARTGQFKKKATLSHFCNEVTSEPTITRYGSIVRKSLKVLICKLTNTQCGNPVSRGTRQSDSPFLSRFSPACPCLWLSQRRWPYTVRLLCLGVCQGRRLRTTPAKWSSRIETAHHRRCGNYKQGHAGESPERKGLSDWRVPCDTAFPHCVFVR